MKGMCIWHKNTSCLKKQTEENLATMDTLVGESKS